MSSSGNAKVPVCTASTRSGHISCVIVLFSIPLCFSIFPVKQVQPTGAPLTRLQTTPAHHSLTRWKAQKRVETSIRKDWSISEDSNQMFLNEMFLQIICQQINSILFLRRLGSLFSFLLEIRPIWPYERTN